MQKAHANKVAAQDENIIRISNNWSCIQAYYIFYHCTQAIMIAKGNDRPDTHAKTQKAFINLWSDRKVDLAPWTLTYDAAGVINLPLSAQVDMTMHVWNRCDSNSCWSLVCKSLKSTRSESYDEAVIDERNKKRKSKIQAWEKDEKTRILSGKKPRKKPNFPMPQLVQHQKQAIANRLRAFSIFDYLYRLRIKTNYLDSDMFTEGPVDEFSSIKIADQLRAISSATIFLTELYLLSMWGKDNFLSFRKSWVDSRVQTPVADRFFARAHLLASHKIL